MRFSVVALLLTGVATMTLLTPAALVAAAAPCDVAMKMRLSGSRKLRPGSTLVARATLKSTTSSTLVGLNFQFELPSYLIPIKGAVSRHASAGASPFTNQGGRAVFANLTLHAKKQLKVALRIGVPQCQALGPVAVGAAAYQLDDNGLVTCSTTATPATVEVVKQPHKAKRAAWDAGTCVACLDYQQVGPKLIGTSSRVHRPAFRMMGGPWRWARTPTAVMWGPRGSSRESRQAPSRNSEASLSARLARAWAKRAKAYLSP